MVALVEALIVILFLQYNFKNTVLEHEEGHYPLLRSGKPASSATFEIQGFPYTCYILDYAIFLMGDWGLSPFTVILKAIVTYQ